VYDFADTRPLSSHRALLPFDMYRETFVVLALSNGKEYDQTAAQDSEGGILHQAVGEFAECIMSLQDNYLNALVHRLVLFDFDTEGVKLPSNTVTIPSVERASATALKTMMADITSTLLEELSALASSIRGLPNVETPKATTASGIESEKDVQRQSRPNSRLSMIPDSGKSSPGPDAVKAQHRASMPPHLSMPDLSPNNSQRPPSGTSTPPSSFDEMSGISSRPTAAETSVHSNERISMQGFGSGTAGERARNQAQSRIGVVVGSLYLLAGKWPDAVKELSNGAISAKANSDYAWHAKALDFLLVTLLMQAWAKVEFEVGDG
jgi:trafficking protein particle complex subunit 9